MSEVTRLDRLRTGNVGNLGFLPIEICNKIYTFLLAEFRPTEIQQCDDRSVRYARSVIKKQLPDFTRAQHSIDTAILRTSHDIYCEAYDLMVKKNRFVRVTSQGVPRCLLNAAHLPVVTAVTDHVNRFRGYVLKVTMAFPGKRLPGLQTYTQDSFEAMILARDLEKLCLGIITGDLFIPSLKSDLSLTLYLGTMITVRPETPEFEGFKSLQRWFCTEKNQQKIIQPFFHSLKGFEDVRLVGLVLGGVIDSFSQRATSDDWGSPQSVMDYLNARNETGKQHLAAKRNRSASATWIRGICEMNTMRGSVFWPRLVQEGGEDFVISFARLYFGLNLDCVALHMDAMGRVDVARRLAAALLEQARVAASLGRWKEGLTWEPTKRQTAEFNVLKARFLIRGGISEDFHQAVLLLQEAMRLFPDEGRYFEEYCDLLV